MTQQGPTVQQIRRLCTDTSFERGQSYYKRDSVRSARIRRSVVSAQVLGTYEYSIKVRMPIYDGTSSSSSSSCTSPYDGRGICKHIVAVLLHASENFVKMLVEEKQRILDIDCAIRHVPAGALKEFFDAARTYDKHVEVAEAIRIYRDIAEAMTDDSDPEEVYRYDLDDLARAVDYMASCILRQKQDYLHKCRHISYRFEQYVKNCIDYSASAYHDAIGRICIRS